jgi:predicted RNA binding protein YcfA (HicA-like mRNA interferase family)
MPKLIKPKDLIKILNKLGFEETRIRGSHHRLVHIDGRKVSVPVHGSEQIGKGLLNKIIKKDVKISKKEFENLLKELILL